MTPAPADATAWKAKRVSHNSFGKALRVTTWGESHGPAIGCVVDGCPPGLPLTEADIQPFLDRRRPGGSRHVTQRREADEVRILSGVFDDGEGRKTTGAPIALHIDNVDARSKDYAAIADRYRPGHADFAYDAKYGLRDPRGGGRASARETAMRVAAGAIARRILGPSVTIRAAVTQIGPIEAEPDRWDWDEVDRNPFFGPDPEAASAWDAYLDQIRKYGDSVGAMVQLVAEGVPPGLGEPIYGKLDADLAAALIGINAAKGVDIGLGMAAAGARGADAADEMRMTEDRPHFLSNRNGGVLGGISTGQAITARIAFKPTSSIRIAKRSVTRDGAEIDVATTGRHDPCVGIRAVPVVEAMAACVLADHLLRHRGQTGRDPLAERG